MQPYALGTQVTDSRGRSATIWNISASTDSCLYSIKLDATGAIVGSFTHDELQPVIHDHSFLDSLPAEIHTLLDGIRERLRTAPPIQHHIAIVALQTLETLLRKNTDYGSSVFFPPELNPTLPAESAVMVRLNDKLCRMRTLLSSGEPHQVAESLDDTIGDAIGYEILWLVIRRIQSMGLSPVDLICRS